MSLSVQGLSVNYGKVTALQSVSFSLAPGGLALVLGANGAGKTTLVSAIAGLVKAAAGDVLVGGTSVVKRRADQRARLGISLVPEGRGLLPGMTVEENLQLGWRVRSRSERGTFVEARERAFNLFPRLHERRLQDCGTLSGGEMQMLAIARALAANPRVLLLDEPSLGLAPQAVETVYASLVELSAMEDGPTMLIVEQKTVPLPEDIDLTIVLGNGRVIYETMGRRPSSDELARLYFQGEI